MKFVSLTIVSLPTNPNEAWLNSPSYEGVLYIILIDQGFNELCALEVGIIHILTFLTCET